MSNCIQLHDALGRTKKVVLLKDEIDVPAFKAFVDRAKQLDYSKQKPGVSGDVFTEEELNLNVAWWFLQENTFIDARGAVIRFGEGRSIHTWRDFRATLGILKYFLTKSKWHQFVATDESDGHQKAFLIDVNLKTGEIV